MNKEQYDNAVQRFKKIFTKDVINDGNGVSGRPGAANLLTWLESTDFFQAPASTRFHGAFEGGLLLHSLAVYDRLTEYGNGINGYQTTAIVGLLHDLCKVNTYKPTFRNVKVYKANGSKTDGGGKFDWEQQQGYEIDDQLPYGHGEKSVYLIRNHMGLTEEEAMAIRWHMGGFDVSVRGGDTFGVNKAFERYSLAVELHVADMKATYFDAV